MPTWAKVVVEEADAMSGIEQEDSPEGSESSLDTLDDRVLDYEISDEPPEAEAGAEIVGGLQDETMMDEGLMGGIGLSTLGLTWVTVRELIIRDAWLNWEEDMRPAHQQRVLAQAMTLWNDPERQVEVRQLTVTEEERFVTRKSQYINQPVGFEEERMVGDALGFRE